MTKDNSIYNTLSKSLNKNYLANRKQIIKFLKPLSDEFSFQTKTYFNAIYYIDIILSQNNAIEKISDFLLIAISALILSAKYFENDMDVPEIKTIISRAMVKTKNFKITVEDIKQAEIFVLYSLKYKLNNYSTYHYLAFFFNNGLILRIGEQHEENNRNTDEILEKIYELSREVLDFLNSENVITFGDDCFVAASAILHKSINIILGNEKEKFNLDFDVFTQVYHIETEQFESLLAAINIMFEIIQMRKRMKISQSSSNSKKSVLTSNNSTKKIKASSERKARQSSAQPFRKKLELIGDSKEDINYEERKHGRSVDKYLKRNSLRKLVLSPEKKNLLTRRNDTQDSKPRKDSFSARPVSRQEEKKLGQKISKRKMQNFSLIKQQNGIWETNNPSYCWSMNPILNQNYRRNNQVDQSYGNFYNYNFTNANYLANFNTYNYQNCYNYNYNYQFPSFLSNQQKYMYYQMSQNVPQNKFHY